MRGKSATLADMNARGPPAGCGRARVSGIEVEFAVCLDDHARRPRSPAVPSPIEHHLDGMAVGHGLAARQSVAARAIDAPPGRAGCEVTPWPAEKGRPGVPSPVTRIVPASACAAAWMSGTAGAGRPISVTPPPMSGKVTRPRRRVRRSGMDHLRAGIADAIPPRRAVLVVVVAILVDGLDVRAPACRSGCHCGASCRRARRTRRPIDRARRRRPPAHRPFRECRPPRRRLGAAANEAADRGVSSAVASPSAVFGPRWSCECSADHPRSSSASDVSCSESSPSSRSSSAVLRRIHHQDDAVDEVERQRR